MIITEYFEEVSRATDPWKSHPRRMLRHKAIIQCARVAFAFTGIKDEDEAEVITAAEVIDTKPLMTILGQYDDRAAERAALLKGYDGPGDPSI